MSWGERTHRVVEAYRRRTVKLDEIFLAHEESTHLGTSDVEQLIAHADLNYCEATWAQVQSGIHIYGQSWPRDLNGVPLWHMNLNGKDVGDIPAFKVSYRNSGDLQDDVRLNWELNRLGWLVPVALHARVSKDKKAIEYCFATIQSFLDTDRVGYSSRWSSAIELAMQALALVVLDSSLDLAVTQPKLHQRISSAQLARFTWLEKFPSKYSSANNHRLAELAALVVLSSLINENHKFFEKYLAEFSNESAKQFNSDGLNAELATDYHLYAFDLILTVLMTMPNEVPESLRDLAIQISSATKRVQDYCGFWPRISDSDHAALLGQVVAESDRPRMLVNLAQDLLGIEVQEEDLLTLTFLESGYSFLKSSVGKNHLVLMVDHGYLGFGDIAGHAHADSGAIWTWLNGNPILVESGTYSYHSQDDVRNNLRSSMMHNTISINGTSTSTPSGPFLWLKSNRAEARLLEVSHNHISIEVSIPSNAHLKKPAKHVRQIELSGLQLTITDTVTCQEPFRLACHYLVHSQKVSGGTSGANFDISHSQSSLEVLCESPVFSSQTDDVQVSPEYGSLIDCQRVTFSTVVSSCSQTLITNLKLRP